jgi:hypothetical protein
MVAKLISKLSSHRRTRITLEVRETNLPRPKRIEPCSGTGESVVPPTHEAPSRGERAGAPRGSRRRTPRTPRSERDRITMWAEPPKP